MESSSKTSIEINGAPSHYQNPLNDDDDLVDMNEIIRDNLDNWNMCADTGPPALQCSQEIKLESYNFLGNRINYEDDKFELDAYTLPDNYFKRDELPQYESEDESEQPINGVHEIIDIADDDDDDDDNVAVIDLLNSSSETQNASSVSISAHLESIRSDHNYSSQEVFVGSQNYQEDTPSAPEAIPETTTPEIVPESTTPEIVPDLEPLNAPVDHVNEMQALIVNWMNDATSENKVIILNNLENEIKRLKSTMVQDTQPNEEISPVADVTVPINVNSTNFSDENENDSFLGMSEGHSEPLEYRGIVDEIVNDRIALTEEMDIVSDHVDEETLKTLKCLRLAVKDISTKVDNFTKLFTNETFTGETVKTQLTDLSNSGQAMIQSFKAMAVSLQIEIDINVNNTASVSEIEPVVSTKRNDSIDAESNGPVDTDVSDKNEKVDEIVNCQSFENNNANGLADDIEENITDPTTEPEVEQNIEDTVVGSSGEKIDGSDDISKAEMIVDKQQLDLNLKKRWLASSSEDEPSSDESISENVSVKRRKKRARTTSTSDEASSTKNQRKRNVLLDSSDDERSMNGSGGYTLKDIDISKYLLPMNAPANTSIESDMFKDMDEQRPDSELEEFFGFDGPACHIDDLQPSSLNQEIIQPIVREDVTAESASIDQPIITEVAESESALSEGTVTEETVTDVIVNEVTLTGELSSLNQETIHSTVDEDITEVATETESIGHSTITEVAEGESALSENTATEEIVADRTVTEETVADGTVDDGTVNEVTVTGEPDQSTHPMEPYVQSQVWDLPGDPIVHNGTEDSEVLDHNLSPKKEIENAEYAEEENVDAEKDNEENNHVEEEGSVYDTDEEIDRLVDLTNIQPTRSRPIVNYVPVYKKKSVTKPKPKEDILDILKDSASQEIDSESSSEEDIVSEEQYVLQLAKQQCLKDSSDSDAGDSVSETNSDDDLQSSIDDASDESNDSKLNKFLKKRLANGIEDDLDTGRKVVDAAPKENHPVDEHDADETKSEPDMELRSSGIFEPEIELHDGEKIVENTGDNSDPGEIAEQRKEPKKQWKLDKIAFSKNLFNDLDDVDEEKSTKAANSENSDCEMLDISMFKTKKGGADLDQIIQNQKKRDVSKVSSKVADECISLSSDSDLEIDKGTIDDDSEDDKPTKSRPMLRNDQLAGETKQAQKEETDRLKRLEKKTERLTQIVESQSQRLTQSQDDSDVILDFDTKKNSAISVHPEIVKNLKEHQIAGVKFMYDCCYGSVDSIEKHNGSGCILAHCMGLGKTLQLIALLHTLIRYPQLKTKKILVICPKSTIMNWAEEIKTWLSSVKVKLKVLHFPDPSDIKRKLEILREWHDLKAGSDGRAGCMLIGYEAFRSLVFYTERKQDMSQFEMDRIKKAVDEYLLKPGADLVVCDEGHIIKNRKSTTSRAVNKIASRRRIILTGTPIQNNLKEYYSMVNFIKPSFLGTEKEFANLYENPIKEGQHKDSNNAQIRIMKQRSYVLHKKLSKFVQRREAALLKTFLPEKYEYVLFIPMTELQNNLYQHFLDNNPLKEKYGGKSLIPDYTFLRKIWTHPKVLENAWKNAVALRDKKAAARRRNMDSDEEPDDVLDNQAGKMSVENDWWRQFIEPQDLRSLLPSNKLRILFEILKLCAQNREKCLIFSAFVAVLDVVEYFMEQIHNKVPYSDGNDLGLDNFHGPWIKNQDFYRLDGKTPKQLRHAMIQKFNDPSNFRVKCFLISAKAGGQGINLVGANRVILLDTSWNPSNDQQNIFRVFRLGQQKKCYIYRLLAMGTMEEKVYSRSVTKQAMSFRVVDEQQIDRHYSLAELAELYTLTKPDPAAQPTPIRPADNILASLLRNFKNLVYKYHEHDSLLENNSAEDLNEQEKADAWEAYEKDVSMKNPFGNMNITADGPYSNYGFNMNMMNMPYYMPPNLPASMVPSYLQRMGYTGVEQELLLMSQMYSHLNQPGGSSGYNPLGAMFNSSVSAATNQLYNSTSGNSNYYKSSITQSTTSSSSSYSNIVSNVFNGINQLTSSSSSSAVAAAAAAQYNLARYMPPYSGSSSSVGQQFPFNLYASSANATTTNSAQSLASTAQPGPNAIKNPLLSNLLPPSTSNTKDYSIPTSVITKVSKDIQRVSNTPIGSSSNTSNSSHQKSAAHSSHSGSSLSTSKSNSLMARASPQLSARDSPSLSARGSPSIVARSSPSVKANIPSTRTSPSESRSGTSITRNSMDSPHSLSITRTSTTANKNSPIHKPHTSQMPLSITLTGSNRTSPEPNIIVKDVSAINRTVERKSAPATSSSSSKTPAQPIRNFNMGIVYPKAPERKSFDLSQNEPLLKAAQNQMQQSNATRTSAPPNHSAKTRISPAQPPSRTVNRPVMTSINRMSNAKSVTRPSDTSVSSTLSSASKNLSSPSLPTNEVTITPTKRVQKDIVPMSSIRKLITSSTSHKQSPNEINKFSNSALSVSRLPSSTSITRQLPNSSSSNTIASLTRQLPNSSSSSANATLTRHIPISTAKQVPRTSIVQGTIPTLKLISQSGNTNNKAIAITRAPAATAAINRNVVATNNGANKTQRPNQADIRKVLPNSAVPRLATFANPSSDSRKRKLEELIPKNTGVTLIKKPKVAQPDNVFVQSKKISPQRPRDPTTSSSKPSTVEIVELD